MVEIMEMSYKALLIKSKTQIGMAHKTELKTNGDIENYQRNLWHNATKAEIVDTGGDERKGAYDSISYLELSSPEMANLMTVKCFPPWIKRKHEVQELLLAFHTWFQYYDPAV